MKSAREYGEKGDAGGRSGEDRKVIKELGGEEAEGDFPVTLGGGTPAGTRLSAYHLLEKGPCEGGAEAG